MAYNDDQNPTELPAGGPIKRRSSDHLPRYFRTQVNNKFLSSTIDQLMQPGTAEKLSGYFGQQEAKGRLKNDFYIGDVSKDREDYQFEPAIINKDDLNNINFYADYNDVLNQLKTLGSSVKDHSVLNQQEYYAWNPNINWDKFVNFREYFWLPNGPQVVQIAGEKDNVEKTIKVKTIDNGENYGYVFTPDGLTQNPVLTLFRGIKYIFEIDAVGNPLSFRTRKQTAPKFTPNVSYVINDQVSYGGSIYLCIAEHYAEDDINFDNWELDTTFNLTSSVSANGVEKGTIELTLDQGSPDLIYYMSETDLFASGTINVLDIEEATSIDIDETILGTKTYTSELGISLSNGMKVEFVGNVTPAKYGEGFWYVEGVGESITLRSEVELNVPSSYTSDLAVDFDSEGFDTLPYSEAIGYPANKDYITINRASTDGNLWSKYNRWFHKDVIEKSAEINNQLVEIDLAARATRPIIEFEANLKLFNYGTAIKDSIDLVDNFTKDIFSTIEGAQGYNIDDVDITNGMRILFTADTDPLVVGKIYEVQFITFNNVRQITLKETTDTAPLLNEVVLCKQGSTFKGNMLWYNGTTWKLTQQKTSLNQQPLFDVFSSDGYSYANSEYYESSTFTGTSIFTYCPGAGNNDTELGFPLKYRSIENVGDIVFKSNFLQDKVTYVSANDTLIEDFVHKGYLRKYSDRSTFTLLNGWEKANVLSNQPVIRQYLNDNTRTFFTVDVYDRSATLDDLWLRVFVNNDLKFKDKDYTLSQDANENVIVTFNKKLAIGDKILLKTRSKELKNDNGKYQIASNLERNPLNSNVQEFTLSEINDHVGTIVEEVDTFDGVYPGTSNLRDLGDLAQYGKRIVKHSSPFNLSAYHIVNKDANVIKSLKFARTEYSKFKRSFIQVATKLGFSGPVKDHVDLILKEITRDKTNVMPYYFSDMVPFSGSILSTTEVFDSENNFFALNTKFTLNTLSDFAVQVYLNGVQLLHNRDYTFNDQGFVVITAPKVQGDRVDIYEYQTTNGSFIPPTPTKLGLYPKYEPSMFEDNTYLETQTVIQGHDGSITVAYGDYRDDLLLELEKRIYNNIKIEYNTELFNIYDYIPGHSRETSLTQTQIDNSMIGDFINWLQLVDDDYTQNLAFERENPFTFNHTGMVDVDEHPVNGYWRAVYKYAYDTDRPHTHPWEMLGFTIKPTWWDTEYGEAPYTSNNLLMWEDIQEGIIRTPGTPGVKTPMYARKFITTHIPVDESGNLVSPILSSFIKSYNTTDLNDNFKFGDHSPVETAWRKSSEYAFSLITSLVLNQPARTFSTIFDRARQIKGTSKQINYSVNNTVIALSNIQFPNSIKQTNRVYTSGLINYIFDYLSSNVNTPYETYKSELTTINNQIAFKIGGYTTKDKFKLILDSRTPTNKGNVFVPEENYTISLNKSAPIKNIHYSGVIIEKQTGGFIVKGYDRETPYFNINKAIPLQNDPIVKVGGISASYVEWNPAKTYVNGAIVENQNSYYRCVEQHVSSNDFDNTKFVKLPDLPVEGGREAYFRKSFKNTVESVSYGTTFKTIQEVVDFMLGYSYYLESQGFVFDYYSATNEFVSSWQNSAKEFMFWSTQNWGAGAVITLSPAAFELKFRSEYAIVDDIYDTFYGYSLLKADGKKLQPQFVSLTRENPKEFTVRPKATEDGIFSVRLSLVQKEHIVVIDNKTVFGDIIYDLEPGYRQERIKVLGYRTTEWDGSLNIPGFVFDNAKTTEWASWTDYAISDVVKYKEFYYSANNKIAGTENFEARQWTRLNEKPSMDLLPNFEYKTNQFADFYDLDTDNFDLEQQKFAQHLIGYQNRDYLANIINDDVSQYKFYQGMLQDKGTKNSLTKLFDVLSSADKDSLEFYEEWAIKQGQYGAAEGFDEVEYILDEDKFKLQPQSVELVNSSTGEETDLIYRIKPFETYLRPNNYNHKPFPTKYVKDTYTKNSGYVNQDDVQFVVDDYESLANVSYADVRMNDLFWVGNVGLSWNVYVLLRQEIELEKVNELDENIELQFTTNITDIEEGDFIGIEYTDEEGETVGEFVKAGKIINNRIAISNSTLIASDTVTNPITTKFISVRVDTYKDASNLVQTYKQGITKIWVDEDSSKEWKVIENTPGYENHQVIENAQAGISHDFGYSLAASNNNTLLCVGAPDNNDGKVFVYVRAGNAGSYQLNQIIEPTNNLADAGQKFGSSIDVDASGRYLVVGSPEASNVKSFYKNEYVTTTSYNPNDIVRYKDNIWQANKEIDGATDAIQFGSFDSVAQIMVALLQTEQDDNPRPTVLTGDYPFSSTEIDADFFTDHWIVKAPKDMYDGSGIGDTVKLRWNDLTYANQSTVEVNSVAPFAGSNPLIDEAYITGSHTIVEKIDSILYVENSTTIPLVGQIVESLTGFGEVAYTFNVGAKVTIYIKDQNGTFGTVGSITTSIGEFVGEFITAGPDDTAVDADDSWGGYWRFNTPSSYLVDSDVNSDLGRGLVYLDVTPVGITDQNRIYYNNLDYETSNVNSVDTNHNQLITLSYDGSPGPDEVAGEYLSSLFVLKAPKPLTDLLDSELVGQGDENNPTLDVFYNPMPNFLTGELGDRDPTTIGLNVTDINKTHTVYDVWDGWIDFRITKNLGGDLIDPKVGLTVRDVTNLGTAEIMFYQRFDTNNGRIYVKNITGTWAVGNLFNENREIEFLSDGSGDPLYDPVSGQRIFGQIEQRSFPSDVDNIGKFIVLDRGNNIQIQDIDNDVATREDTITNGEYWFFREAIVDGISRAPNLPTVGNNDWDIIYNVPASTGGTIPVDAGNPATANEGMYSIYERRGIGSFVKINSFIVPDRASNLYLGSDVKITSNSETNKLFVKSTGDNTTTNPGRIYIFNNGEFDGVDYGWESSRDKLYTGPFDTATVYFTDEIVYYNAELYRAKTTTGPGAFDSTDWTVIADTEIVDYLGYLPNKTGNIVGENAVIDSVQLTQFAKAFDTDSTGEVIVVTTEYSGVKDNSIEVYRNVNGSFYKHQTITAPNKDTNYGENIAISNDGSLIAVGAPYDDTESLDQGKVYIYKKEAGMFALSQTLYSPTKEKTELFGWTVDFDGSKLIIGSKNGDSSITTTFDGTEVGNTLPITTFDNQLTGFKTVDVDTGNVRVYERLEDNIIYAQTLDYDIDNVVYFGNNILLKNNHVYVGLPEFETSDRMGLVVDYRIQDNTNVWSVLRSAKNTVDVSKIKRAMLYDRKTNEIIQYIDYIDPLQGKVAGPAEQELTYKTYYDPATYTTGTLPNTDPTNSWSGRQEGQLWWDLSNAKFKNPYQLDVIFSANNWNTLFSSTNTIDVYEWVKSKLLPSEWDELTGTAEGIAQGITGTTKSGDDAYVVKREYNKAIGVFTNYYYYWVKDKSTIPAVEGRVLSSRDVAGLIADPGNQKYKFISLISNDQFAVHNCESILRDQDVVLSIQYWTIDNQEINVHNQYQIVTEGLETSVPNRDIQRKWFDSLVGYDEQDRQVPAPELSDKEKYGILNRPRQGWFVNREEALKQVITRANSVLAENLIADNKDITALTETQLPPSEQSRRWDRSVDTRIDLQFVGVAKAEQAQITPVIENGNIVRVNITNPGRGYLQAPTITILGIGGSGAELETVIDGQGRVTEVIINSQGINYPDNTILTIRRYTVLVQADNTLAGKWALYERDVVRKEWILVESQSYNVNLYWEYLDWYDTGYNSFTNIDFIIDFSYNLTTINDNIGDIIKIQNVGTGGWLLLEKIDSQNVVDYSINYKTIGRQNGTIQFKETLYNVEAALVGFDTTSYDVLTFDSLPATETRIILNTIKDKIFVNDLALEYNKLFFASLRYVFAEQNYVDWAFKSSFLKAKHNVGQLEQKVNFQNDNLPSYEAYIKEVKPYKTKVREYLSSYEALDNSQTITSDFDLPARFVEIEDSIQPLRVKTSANGIIADNPEELVLYPNRNWADNAGYKVLSIELSDAGIGYTTSPVVTIEGNRGATATATLGQGGKINRITVVTNGNGYLEAPTITINGSIAPNGREAKAFAIIGDSPVRSLQTVMKFDRVSGVYEFVTLNTSETFVSSGKTFNFNLKWPMDLRTSRITVFENNEEVLARRYTYSNILDNSKGYNRYFGQVKFIDPPAANTEIRIEYFKSINLLKAQDRINLAYEPTGDNFGKTLGQLMTGVDYGGVEVTSFDFGGTTGWNSSPWMAQGWDVFDSDFEDEIFQLSDDSTRTITFAKPLEDGLTYNVYKNGIRIDADDWDSVVPSPTNPNAVMLPITGAGQTGIALYDDDTSVEDGIIVFDEDIIATAPGDVLIFRKTTSDGSFIADPESYDTAISGGDLVYNTATGLDSASINIDGDGFVTPTTSKGPEEVVPGQVLDTLDIQVFEKPTGGASQITSRNYIGNGVQAQFDIGSIITQIENLFVKVNYQIIDKTAFTLDFSTNRIIFNTPPGNNERVSIMNVGFSATAILDIDTFIGNGTAIDFLTSAQFEENASAYVTVNGIATEVSLIRSDDTYDSPDNFVIRFATAPAADSAIQMIIATGGIEVPQQYSTVTIDEIITDGSSTSYELSQAPFEDKPEQLFVLVKVGNEILDPGYSQTFQIIKNQREYQLDLTQVPVASINSYDLLVYLNDIELEYLQTWTFEGAGSFDSTQDAQSQPGSTITLTAGIGDPGDELKVVVVTGSDYRMGYLDTSNDFVKTPNEIYFDEVYPEDTKVEVYQFSNDKSQGIERQTFEVTEKTETTPGTPLYYSFALLRRGYITLRKPARDSQYVWVIKNGTLLMPNVDYIVTSNKNYVKLAEQPVEGDKLQVIHFAENIVADKFGWRQFKDMLNRTHYKRLQEVQHLAQPLNWYDNTIEVVDATDLPDPEVDSKYPGIIFIEGERIEYFGKNGNTLQQLRRGTLGTGIKNVYDVGTMFMEQGSGATLPYKDDKQVVSVTAGGFSTGSDEYENSLGVSITSIAYDFNNNTAFPLGGQVCTVTGTGFTDRAVLYVGETEVATTFVSDTELTFVTPALPVGAYDLIIVNPFTNVPIDTPQTSFVLNGGIEYVQVLLPFAPIPNPTSAIGWYKNTIPDEYWEAQDIEVFVAGTRLRKKPTKLYNYSEQDSPEGDIDLEAEYAVNKAVGAYVRLTKPPAQGTTVNIFRTTGKTWSNTGESIAQSDSNVAKFLRDRTTELPR